MTFCEGEKNRRSYCCTDPSDQDGSKLTRGRRRNQTLDR